MPPEPYNPAVHGGVTENWRTVRRSGFAFTLMGIIMIVVAIMLALLMHFFLNISWGFSGRGWLPIIAVFLPIIVGIIFIVMGAWSNSRARYFTNKIEELKTNGMVSRGAILNVRNDYKLFGRTFGTRQGDVGAMDSGWFFRVYYNFQDENEELRRSNGYLPDPLGPKRKQGWNGNQQTFIDPNMPRIGQRVDILFNDRVSVILRVVDNRHM